MSFSNVLPWWVIVLEQEDHLAKMACAFDDELLSGTHKETPPHIVNMSKATFHTWKRGGWNYIYSKEEIESLMKGKTQ